MWKHLTISRQKMLSRGFFHDTTKKYFPRLFESFKGMIECFPNFGHIELYTLINIQRCVVVTRKIYVKKKEAPKKTSSLSSIERTVWLILVWHSTSDLPESRVTEGHSEVFLTQKKSLLCWVQKYKFLCDLRGKNRPKSGKLPQTFVWSYRNLFLRFLAILSQCFEPYNRKMLGPDPYPGRK